MEVGEPNANGRSSYTPEALPSENHDDAMTHHNPCLGTVIPSRIFVGGIDRRVSESSLRHVFSQYGGVKEVKIVVDRSGMSKGYGFVTFETEDDALKVLNDANGIHLKDRKLSVAQAVRKQQTASKWTLINSKRISVANPDSTVPLPMSCGTLYHTTSTGYPYTYQNGVAYFHCPTTNHLPHHWPPAPPVMHPQAHQPVYQQPPCHLYQYVPNQYQWNVTQSLVPSGPVMYSHPSEYLYQPPNEGSVLENTTQELLDPTVQQIYPLYPQSAEGMRPVVLQHDPAKNQTFPHLHVHPQPKYRRHINHKDHRCLPEATEPPDSSTLHTSQTLM
ncbi:protein boule-like [Chaetodon trifascialis]|uniref:protein boule-like n=1 Tax=Chaetodon trifascialis TaxID=109706 RepID=UPI003993416D